MELIYRKSQSPVKPIPVEFAKKTVFLRKDFEECRETYVNGTEYIYWTYQEAKMSPDEFNEYIKVLSATNAMNIDNIMVGQENGDNNQLIIMEAIADLYDMIAGMQ